MTTYVTNPTRAGLGLTSGAVIGAASWALAFVMSTGDDVAVAAPIVLLVGPAALIVYVLGLGLLGGPVWLILHELGRRDPLSAVVLGGVLNALPIGLPSLINGTTDPDTYGVVALAAAIGALVGLVIWRVAYRRGT
ncbi:hypothetical protein [Caulobacter sp. 17J80-11]|uniref:hypothetical protein n=1 Tax=Caulobacter sp. 17J80-11 TaxID=2763502 RepID=UPI001653EE5C|nr:hypothetical protein [Caulobacter sp. 17J80-11]MBC6982620.1 hypothetical protein [Caulobacter sp. 17J80-11]